jgi:hypothetical protein
VKEKRSYFNTPSCIPNYFNTHSFNCYCYCYCYCSRASEFTVNSQ